jgi:uncharacterized membrane protein YfcA
MTGESWIALPAGIIISSAVSMIGIGGGVLWMPFFLIVLHLRPEAAVVTSLFIQMGGMGSASYAFFKQKRIDAKFGLFIILAAAPGIAAGAWVSGNLPAKSMEMILGILMMATAFLFVSSNEKYDSSGKTSTTIKSAFPYSGVIIPASFGSGLLSISMSEWLIPIMRSKLELRMSTAIATSIFVAFGTCSLGAIFHLALKAEPDIGVIGWALPGVITGGQIGPRILKRINERLLKEAFIFLLTLVGIHLIYHAY